MGGHPLEELPRDRFREKESGLEVEGSRIYGWLIWNFDGPQLIEPGDFEAQYEPVDTDE